MYYEIIYEDGSHSVSVCESDEQVLIGATDHHNRAKEGLPGHSPAFDRETGVQLVNRPAVRVKRILVYPEHPADLSAPATLSVDEMTQRFNDALNLTTDKKSKQVDWPEALFLMTPQPRLNNGPHDSNYSAKETREIPAKEWGGDK